MTNIITKKEWLSIFPEAIPYLEEDMEYQLKKFDILKEIYNNQLDINSHLKTQEDKDFSEIQADIFIGEDIKITEHRIKEIDRYLRKDNPTNGITDNDIERAKEYPFENLLKFNRTGFALCPFHTEKTPSLHLNKNNNKVHCFGCSKTWDTIQFIIDSEGLDFIKAVRVLK